MGAMRRQALGSLAAAFALMASAGTPTAAAATPIGELFPADNLCGPMVPGPPSPTFLQTTSPTNRYAAPSAGVITSWSHQAGPGPPELRFKVAHPTSGNGYTIVGETPFVTLDPNVVNTFDGIRIPVQAGDVIGFAVRANGSCGRSGAEATGYGTSNNGDDVPLGTGDEFTPVPLFQLSVSAALEPDSDSDGFGDETQDKCVGTAGAANGCPSTVAIDKLKQKGDTRVKVAATVPGSGTLAVGSPSDPALASKAVRSLKAVTQTISSTSEQRVRLTLKLTKSAVARLRDQGKLKLKVKAVYTPPGGPVGSQTKKKKLKS